MQHARRHNPYPWTWEIPAGVCMVLALVAALGVHVGRATANLLAGAGWTWPVEAARFWRSLPAVVGGDAGAGLGHPRPPELARPELVWTAIVVVEVAAVVLLAWAVTECVQRWGPGRLRGMATRSEAETMLGLARLRKVRGVVRPDLYPKRTTRPESAGSRRRGVGFDGRREDG